MNELNQVALEALNTIKSETARGAVDIDSLINAINRDLDQDKIMEMVGDSAISIIELDDGFILSRIIVHMMNSDQRKNLFVNLRSSLVPTLERISIPINDNEVELKEQLYKYQYIKTLFGEGFIKDIITITESDLVPAFVKRWIKNIFCSKYAKKPPWVDVRYGDSPALSRVSKWKSHKSSDMLEKITRDSKIKLESERDDDTQDETKRGDILGYDLEIRESEEFINRLAVVPKRQISYSDSLISNPNRVFGPLNSHIDSECDNGLDGCRMLTCTCHGDFDGICDVCGIKILDRSYTIRFPLEEGGWIGEYCSQRCMLSDNPQNSRVEDMDLYQDGIMDRPRLSKK